MLASKSRYDIQIHNVEQPKLCEAIKICREALNLSYADLAEQLFLSEKLVRDIEECKISLSSQIIERYADIFGLSVKELIAIANSDRVLIAFEPEMRSYTGKKS